MLPGVLFGASEVVVGEAGTTRLLNLISVASQNPRPKYDRADYEGDTLLSADVGGTGSRADPSARSTYCFSGLRGGWGLVRGWGAKGSGFRVRDLSLGLKEVQGSGYSLYVFT